MRRPGEGRGTGFLPKELDPGLRRDDGAQDATSLLSVVAPAKAGAQVACERNSIPAFAGMTRRCAPGHFCASMLAWYFAASSSASMSVALAGFSLNSHASKASALTSSGFSVRAVLAAITSPATGA